MMFKLQSVDAEFTSDSINKYILEFQPGHEGPKGK